MKFQRRGQSILEYSILLAIIIAAFIAMQIYIKRGFQGRWKSSVDEIGDQYDPNTSNSVVTYRMTQNSETHISIIRDTVSGVSGFYTVRDDSSAMSETKDGIIRIAH